MTNAKKEEPMVIDVEQSQPTVRKSRRPQLTTNRPGGNFSISYEYLVWTIFFIVTALFVLDRCILSGDVFFRRHDHTPQDLLGENLGEIITNIVWALTARVLITSQNMMFYTMLWCFPNMLSEIAPRWVTINGIRDVHTKMHRFIGLFMIAIPTVVHVLVIFLPPLIDGTPFNYYPPSSFNYSKYPDHLNWSRWWDPAKVDGWTINDHRGVHVTSDEIYRFILMIVLFGFLFPLSRSQYLNSRSYSFAMTLHAFVGIWYAVDNIRKITHPLAHIFNLPMLIIWCMDRLFCVTFYRRKNGRIIRKDVIGNNEYTVVFMKLDGKVDPGVGDVYYLHHNHKLFCDILPQRSHPFTSFSNYGKDSDWDIGLIMTVMEDHEQWCLPWTRWIGGKEHNRRFLAWGPYRSSVWQICSRLLNPSNETVSPHYMLLASGSGFGYLLDVLGVLAHKTSTSKRCQGKVKPTVDIYYSVRSREFYHFFQDYVNELLKTIQEKNTASVTFKCYVTGKEECENGKQDQESQIQHFNCRLDFEKVVRHANQKSFISFVGRPSIAEAIESICQKNGLKLIKDYTNTQGGRSQDRQMLKKYLKISFWAALIIVGVSFIAHLYLDVQKIYGWVQPKMVNKTTVAEG